MRKYVRAASITGGSTAPKNSHRMLLRSRIHSAASPVENKAETIISCPAENSALSGWPLPRYWDRITAPPVVRAVRMVITR